MIPAHEFGGDGPPLHLAHANGYPPAAYTPLAEHLTPHYRVFGMMARPLWPDTSPNGLRDWQPLADDLIRFIDERRMSNVIGAGHSLGGVLTLLAAARRPDLFRAVVLIDPVLFSRGRSAAWGLTKKMGLARHLHPYIALTLRRRRIFADADAMFADYRTRPNFARLDDRALRFYVDALARPRPDGQVELAYSPEWEAHIYSIAPHDLWGQLPKLHCPALVIYGTESDTLLPTAIAEMRRVLPSAKFRGIQNAGHLVPLEKPRQAAECILALAMKSL